MTSQAAATSQEKTAFLVGESPFVRGRLVEALRAGGYRVEDDLVPASKGSLGLIELPGGPEVALLYSSGVRLVGVAGSGDHRLSWPFEAVVNERMSAETILQVCNDVYYRHQGVRQHRRLPVSLEVVVVGGDRALRTSTVNFSRGGAFVRSLNPFPPGSEVILRLVGRPENGQIIGCVLYNIVLHGNHVVRLDKPIEPVVAHPGMAVQFSEGQDEVVERWMEVAEIHHHRTLS